MPRTKFAPAIIKLECGCNYNATFKKGERVFECRHGEWVIRHRTKIEHYYETTYRQRDLFSMEIKE